MNTVESPYYLKLRLNDQLILILLKQIHMVLPIVTLQAIPHPASAMAGILNFHGKALPVYHLSELIDTSKPQYDLNTPLVVCSLSSGLLGLLVSEVIEVIDLAENEIQAQHLDKIQPYVIGLLEREKWSAWILDLEKLFEFHCDTLEEVHE